MKNDVYGPVQNNPPIPPVLAPEIQVPSQVPGPAGLPEKIVIFVCTDGIWSGDTTTTGLPLTVRDVSMLKRLLTILQKQKVREFNLSRVAVLPQEK